MAIKFKTKNIKKFFNTKIHIYMIETFFFLYLKSICLNLRIFLKIVSSNISPVIELIGIRIYTKINQLITNDMILAI